MDWTAERAQQARRTLASWYRKTDGVEANWEQIGYIERALADDLNTHAALTELRERSSSFVGDSPGILKAGMLLLGFPPAEEVDWFRQRGGEAVIGSHDGRTSYPTYLLDMLSERWQELRKQKKYVDADDLKARIAECGVELRVSGEVVVWEAKFDFDANKLEALK